MELEIFGGGCARCRSLEGLVSELVAELELSDISIRKVTDFGEIAAKGVLMTPALAVNGKIVLEGMMPPREKLRGILKDAATTRE